MCLLDNGLVDHRDWATAGMFLHLAQQRPELLAPARNSHSLPTRRSAPPDHKFKVYTSGQKRGLTPQIKREFKRRAAIVK